MVPIFCVYSDRIISTEDNNKDGPSSAETPVSTYHGPCLLLSKINTGPNYICIFTIDRKETIPFTNCRVVLKL